MIFRILGRVVRRAWPLLLVAWGGAVLVTWLAAPPWEEIAPDREFAFLPADAPSRVAAEQLAKAFPDDKLASSIVLVLHRSDSPPGHLERDRQFVADVVEPALRKIAESEGGLADEPKASDEPLFGDEEAPAPKPKREPIVARIRTPNGLGSGALLVSPDGQALLVVVELTTEFLSSRNWPIITKVEQLARDLQTHEQRPPGVNVAVTGSAVIGRDHTAAQLESVHATQILTIVFVVGLLVVIYRAPLLAIIPLLTVYLAVQLSLNLLALLAKTGQITLFQDIQVYITILAYGAGVDYCLFLTARYKEELDGGAAPADAVASAVGGVGAALAASAATVICGIGMMLFAEFGKFREAGLAIPLSLALVLLATLTFSPSLLRLAGRWAFWPRQGPTMRRGLFGGGELQHIWTRVGQVLLRRPGAVWLGTVAVLTPLVIVAGLFYNHISYDLIGALPASAPSVTATRVLQDHFPAGVVGPVTVLLVDPHEDFDTDKGRALVARVTDRLSARRQELGLQDVRSLTAPLGVTKAAKHAFDGHSDIPESARKEGARRMARRYYVSSMGERHRIGTRLDLMLAQGPFERASMEALDRIEHAIRDALPVAEHGGMKLYVAGTTASVRDLAVVMRGDRRRIDALVLAGVFVILVVLLRQLLVPVYLLLSVLFSYFATLGVTFVVFWLLDPSFSGIDFKVAIFLFTILIAVGEDYNIFLLTRVHEEERRHGPVHGVTAGLTRTGPIISSCGIIMAGTFAALLAGSLAEMKQLGFALAFGVLLDTFVVRPVLVPAFLILLRGGRKAAGAEEAERPLAPLLQLRADRHARPEQRV
jgi:RND superfamily putative drug exporter